MSIRSATILVAAVVLAAGSALSMPVGAVNQIIAFGDSLSDSGNATILSSGTEPGAGGYYYRNLPGVPGQVGEFTNAPTPGGPTGVWVDQLSAKLGLPMAQPAAAGGTNYAVGFAQTGSGSTIDVTSQVNRFSTANSSIAPSNALYTIWAGANDIDHLGSPTNAADNLYHNILTLSSEGARYFLWANLPDLGKTPDAISKGPIVAGLATIATNLFDDEWSSDLKKLQSSGISVVGLDVASLFSSIESNPAAYGFSNTDTPAMTVSGANPDTYLFFDSVHPTTAGHALLAGAAFDALTPMPAPEPAAYGLAALGMAALFLAASRARRKQARS
jgi:thermolabile hemolysin